MSGSTGYGPFPLTGHEIVELKQPMGYTTTQEIANLGPGGTGAVTSVAGRAGAVVLAVADVSGAYPTANPSAFQTSAQVAAAVAAGTGAVTTVNSGTSVALAFASSGNVAYDVTLTGNCTFTLSGGTAGQLVTLTLVIRGGAGGFTAALPTGVKWPGGTIPTVDTSAGSYNEFYIRTLDGGATYSGNY